MKVLLSAKSVSSVGFTSVLDSTTLTFSFDLCYVFFFRPTVGMAAFLWLFQLFLAHVIFRDRDYPNITVSIDNRYKSLIFTNGVCCYRQYEYEKSTHNRQVNVMHVAL